MFDSLNWVQNNLQKKYIAKSEYATSLTIINIVEEKLCQEFVHYFDLQKWASSEQHLRRYYRANQFSPKIQIIKQFYYYETISPIFYELPILELYEQWKFRKRQNLNKEFKSLCELTKKRSNGSKDAQQKEGFSRLLLEISEYNPTSQKYYLKNKNNRFVKTIANTDSQVQYFQQQISKILKDMSNISDMESSSLLFSKNPIKLQSKTKMREKKNNEYSTNWTEGIQNKNSDQKEAPLIPVFSLHKSLYNGPKFLINSKSKHKIKASAKQLLAQNKNNVLGLFPQRLLKQEQKMNKVGIIKNIQAGKSCSQQKNKIKEDEFGFRKTRQSSKFSENKVPYLKKRDSLSVPKTIEIKYPSVNPAKILLGDEIIKKRSSLSKLTREKRSSFMKVSKRPRIKSQISEKNVMGKMYELRPLVGVDKTIKIHNLGESKSRIMNGTNSKEKFNKKLPLRL